MRVTEATATDLGSIKELFIACAWDWLDSDTEMLKAFENSYGLYKAESDGQLVGFGRVKNIWFTR